MNQKYNSNNTHNVLSNAAVKALYAMTSEEDDMTRAEAIDCIAATLRACHIEADAAGLYDRRAEDVGYTSPKSNTYVIIGDLILANRLQGQRAEDM